MRKLFSFLCCFLLVLCQCRISFAETEKKEETLSLHALSAVLMDGKSGRVLYGHQEQKCLPMASTTKIMTCILVLELGDTEEFAEVSVKAQSMPKVHLSVREGEHYKISDLLYSLMLESHNDSAVVLAEHIGGSVEGFAELMNQKAAEIGCGQTNFVTPNGLDAEHHQTTAEELAKIMRYCISISEKKEEFLKITRTPSHSFTNYEIKEGVWEAGNRSFTVTNKNAFLSMMEGALSGKTGFTSKAGYCYVGALERDGKLLIVALLGCGWPGNKTWKWEDTRKLMEYGLSNFEYKKWYEPPKLPAVPVYGAKTEDKNRESPDQMIQKLISPQEKAELCLVQEGATEEMLMKSSDKIVMQMTISEGLEAPVEKGEQAGVVSYYLNGKLFASFPVCIGKTMEKIDFSWILHRLVRLYFL